MCKIAHILVREGLQEGRIRNGLISKPLGTSTSCFRPIKSCDQHHPGDFQFPHIQQSSCLKRGREDDFRKQQRWRNLVLLRQVGIWCVFSKDRIEFEVYFAKTGCYAKNNNVVWVLFYQGRKGLKGTVSPI